MIRNQTDYRKAMCKMIRKIQNSSSAEEINDLEMSIEDAEILNDCIENGFVRGKTTYRNHNGEEIELRTMDGKAHSEIFNTVITLKGLEFLKPDRTKTKANLAIIIGGYISRNIKIPRSYQYEPSHPRKYHLMDRRENQVPGR